MSNTIGFLGAGRMASAMITCLLSKGYKIRVWNRSPEKLAPLTDQGAIACETPADTVESCEFVISFMADDIASRHVWLGDNGALDAIAPGTIAIECSTLSHAFVRELADIMDAQNIPYIDAPVTAVPEQVARGETVFLIGADLAVLERARPILESVASKIIHFGPAGSGTVYKLMNNLIGAVHIACAAELVAIAQKAGLDSEQVAQTFLSGALASGPASMTLPGMISGNHNEGIHFTTALRAKDASYAMQLAQELQQAVPVGNAACSVFEHATEAGMGDLAQSAIIDILKN